MKTLGRRDANWYVADMWDRSHLFFSTARGKTFFLALAFFLSFFLSLFFLPLLPAMLLPIISSSAPEDKVHVSLIAGCCCCSSLMQKIMAPPKVIDGERMPADVYSRSKNARRCRPSTEWIVCVCVCVCTYTHRQTYTFAHTTNTSHRGNRTNTLQSLYLCVSTHTRFSCVFFFQDCQQIANLLLAQSCCHFLCFGLVCHV